VAIALKRDAELDTQAVLAAYQARLADLGLDGLSLAARLRQRLLPERWVLEWHLPWWLGHEFGLDPETCTQLVLSNVLGLGSIRLQDDLRDGEVAESDVASATILAAALYEAALDFYRVRFASSSPIWLQLETRMAEWRASIGAEGVTGEPEVLARRAAPLKISAVAVCLLTGRYDQLAPVEAMLDHALAALVRSDDFFDWRADLAAGRWNAFVASASALPQVAELTLANRSNVLAAMMAADAVSAYFAVIRRDVKHAIALAEELRVPALAAYLGTFGSGLEQEGAALHARYRGLGECAAEVLLGAYAQSPPSGSNR